MNAASTVCQCERLTLQGLAQLEAAFRHNGRAVPDSVRQAYVMRKGGHHRRTCPQWTEWRDMSTFVYVLRVGSAGPVKIGKAADVRARVRQIQANHHQTLHVLAVARGGLPLEGLLHRLFHDRRVNGEWFALDDVELSLLLDILSKERSA